MITTRLVIHTEKNRSTIKNVNEWYIAALMKAILEKESTNCDIITINQFLNFNIELTADFCIMILGYDNIHSVTKWLSDNTYNGTICIVGYINNNSCRKLMEEYPQVARRIIKMTKTI